MQVSDSSLVFPEKTSDNQTAPFNSGLVDSKKRSRRSVENLSSFEHGLDSKKESAARQEPGNLTGLRVGDYQLLQRISQRRSGDVYMAKTVCETRARIALKTLRSNDNRRSTWPSEYCTLLETNSWPPPLVRVLEIGKCDSLGDYVVMELVRGLSLNRFLVDRRPNLRERVKILLMALDAIETLHQLGMRHGQLRSTNILIPLYDGNPQVKLTGFRCEQHLSKAMQEETRIADYLAFAQIASGALKEAKESVWLRKLGRKHQVHFSSAKKISSLVRSEIKRLCPNSNTRGHFHRWKRCIKSFFSRLG